jgi:general secretion pathway protein A
MEYFKIINLSKEPFSNSPDPEFFYESRQHVECLQKIELSCRLRRGLNVVIGDVGTGKTTLCRQLVRRFSPDDKLETHLILDPYFTRSKEFLFTMAGIFGEHPPEKKASDWQLKETIKNYLFVRGVDEKKTVILIIDEGQKLPGFCLELLREFLNYETNEYKLLQIVIFAQKEFAKTLERHHNFSDRINLYHVLNPLNFQETRSMIRFRLKRASRGNRLPGLFSLPALWVIYRSSGGYPRKIIHLCHQMMLTLIIQNRSQAGWLLARSCAGRLLRGRSKKWKWTAALTALAGVAMVLEWAPGRFTIPRMEDHITIAVTQKSKPSLDLSQNQRYFPIKISRSASQAPVAPSREIPSRSGSEPVPELPHTVNPMPDVLGKITVKQRETLGEMIQAIYGIYTRQYLNSVAGLNPHITDPDHLEVGDKIRFPAIPVNHRPLPLKYFRVKITTKAMLEDAYRFWKKHPQNTPPVRIVPYWTVREGLQFALVLEQAFKDEKSAQSALKKLPSAVASGSSILASWEDHTVFFTKLMSQENAPCQNLRTGP